MEMSPGFRTIRFHRSQYIDVYPGATVQQMTGDDKAVSAVISLAAQDDNVLTLPAMNGCFCMGNDGMAGIFHEDRRRDGILAVHGRLVHEPHLGRRIEFLHENLLKVITSITPGQRLPH